MFWWFSSLNKYNLSTMGRSAPVIFTNFNQRQPGRDLQFYLQSPLLQIRKVIQPYSSTVCVSVRQITN